MSTSSPAPKGAPDATVVIAMYNEEGMIGRVLREVRSVFPNVVCVDDGSTDHSARVAERAGAIVLRHAINCGQGAALATGISFVLTQTSATHIVTLDADGQHSVDDARRMVEHAISESVDVVLGSRFLQPGGWIPKRKRLLLRAAVCWTRATTGLQGLTDSHNGLRVLTREAAAHIQIRQPRMAHASEILSEIGRHQLTCSEFPVTIAYTPYSLKKGQSLINSVNIVCELALHALRVAR